MILDSNFHTLTYHYKQDWHSPCKNSNLNPATVAYYKIYEKYMIKY
jgi:hypothetical protein